MTTITLLDGSIGQELVRRTGDKPTPLWSTQVMIDQPQAVFDVHTAYFEAGATIATANTYALHRNRLERANLQDDLPHLVQTALTQANAARDAQGSGRIAGALGPLLATYRPDLQPAVDEARIQYGALVNMMQDHVDLILIETVSSLLEAEGALTGTLSSPKPVWISFSVRDDDGTKLRSGEALSDIAPLIDRFNPEAVLINCSRPEAIPAALDILKPLDRPFGAYANGFTEISSGFLEDAPTVDALTTRPDLDPETYAAHAMSWIDQGATIVGGCCDVGPDHIRELARQIRAAGHQIT
jgi:homocysteine S-methyltransferase